MRHLKKSEKFSRSISQRKALIKSLVRALLINESIQTTQSKAKGIRPWIDKLVEWGKDNTLHSRRQAYKLLNDHQLVKRLFEEISPRFKDIPGGYTRIFTVADRKGDGAKLSIIEFTKLEKKEKAAKVKKARAVKAKAGEGEAAAEADIAEKGKSKKGFMKGVKKMFKQDKMSE